MTKEQALKNIALAEALESGKYKQGIGRLRNGDEFCCIGVGCDLVDPRGWTADHCHRGSSLAAAMEVMQQYGWSSSIPWITIGGRFSTASYFNDGLRLPFTEIAKGFRMLAAQEYEGEPTTEKAPSRMARWQRNKMISTALVIGTVIYLARLAWNWWTL